MEPWSLPYQLMIQVVARGIRQGVFAARESFRGKVNIRTVRGCAKMATQANTLHQKRGRTTSLHGGAPKIQLAARCT